MPINKFDTSIQQGVITEAGNPQGNAVLDAGGVNAINFYKFVPSIYSGLKSATTTVTGQSEAIATGATKLRVQNTDATNSVYIGLGTSTSTAEINAGSGDSGVTRFLLLPGSIADISIDSYTHYAWLGSGGTVSLRVTQGV